MTDSSEGAPAKKKAGLFDIRFVIAGLIGVYGVILVLLGIFNASDEELARGDGLNINLWAGLGMLVVAIAFGVWARVRPVVVPVED
jgi:membrane-bound ClpP family serine protease